MVDSVETKSQGPQRFGRCWQFDGDGNPHHHNVSLWVVGCAGDWSATWVTVIDPSPSCQSVDTDEGGRGANPLCLKTVGGGYVMSSGASTFRFRLLPEPPFAAGASDVYGDYFKRAQ